jgi:guanylate kinase
MKGPLIIVSGPSGAGKSTVIARVLERRDLPLRLSVSATTRNPRDHEIDGVHYHFWTPEHFREQIAAGAFLEWAGVHGRFYGTLRAEVKPYLEQGTGVVLDIDVQGAAQVREKCPECVTVFLRPSSMAVLEQRLRGRGTETEEAIQGRLLTAQSELARCAEYQYQVINDDLTTAVARLRDIIQSQFERGSHAG